MMSLICGFQGFAPCPICLVPPEKQNDICASIKLRTVEETCALVDENDEDKLQAQGLQPIQVSIQSNH